MIHIPKQKREIALKIFISIILLLGVFGFGFYSGYHHQPEVNKIFSVTNKKPASKIDANFNPFWKVWNILNEKSIYNKDESNQDRVWGATEGLASSFGDPYTVFLSPKENKIFNEEIHSSFSGIGAEIGMKDKILTIIAPLKNTPAWNAGLKAGDKIIKINNITTNNMNIDKAISLIRGKIGTVVTLTIFRGGENKTRNIRITRAKINVPVLNTKLRKDNIFVISFYTFSENSDILFKKAVNEFLKSGSHKLIIDLRGNPGGYLDSAVNIASLFLNPGKIIVSENFGNKNIKPKVYRSHGPKMFNSKYSFVVLADGGSASASEILAGALQEHKIAPLVGEQTFGKGSVQELIKITNNTSLKVTIAHWLTPNGTSISKHGLTPNFVVPFTKKDFKDGIDPQLQKAVEILEAKK